MKLKLVLLSSLLLLSAGTAWADVRINSANFPDANFRTYLTSQPYGSDGVITDAEIAEINNLMLSSKSIQNLNGIKSFTALQYLSCDGNQLTSLDVSGCASLIDLDCSNNQLTSLDISGCSALTSIMCAQNQLKGEAMDDLIESLPTTQDGGLYVINMKSDGNVMYKDQIQEANAKGWTAYALDGSWSEYSGLGIGIYEKNFPDVNFRNWLLSQSYGSDGVLTDEEIAKVTSMSVSSKGIQSLKGIELFTALTELYCSSNQLTSLDVSKNTALTGLSCSSNQLTSLDVSKNTKLTELWCSSNQLTSLDVSKNTALTYLDCGGNQLTSLDLSKNSALTELWCYSNQLTSLDVSKNTALTYLYCYNNQLSSLDVSKNTKLYGLDCSRNQLTSLDVSKNTKLTSLRCYQNKIKGADMDALVASLSTVSSGSFYVIFNENEQNEMTILQVAAAKAKGWTPYYYTEILWYYIEYSWKEFAWKEFAGSSIVINEDIFPDLKFRNYLLSQSYGSDGVLTGEEIVGLTSIEVTSRNIQSLQGIEYFTALTSLDCSYNQLTSLDVSKNTNLTSLDCSYNQLTSLDVSKNTNLTSLNSSSNQLTSLDVSKNTKLWSLSCYSNQLTSLDVSKNTWLTSLYCYYNQLTSLDVSGCTALTWLECDKNQLTSLDVSKNTKLEVLQCSYNKLTSLDLSKNTALTDLYCNSNQLTSLDLSKNTRLNLLYCYQNKIKGEAMDALVISLPKKYGCSMRVVYNENEQNVMTTTQVAVTKAKGWTPKYTEDGNQWYEYAGVDPATSVNAIDADDAADSAPWYTISGVLLTEKPTQPGIYIHGGKKVVVK